MVDRQGFFGAVRGLFGGHFDQSQVDGMNAILNAFERALPQGDDRWLAYMLATAFHETARTMQPVREAFWLSEEWRRRNLRYYPFYGRGYVQLTWRANYEKAGAAVGVNLVANPDLAMRPDIAAAAMLVGMTEGWFRGDRRGRHTLARYFGPRTDDPSGAREIINGPEYKTIGGVRRLMADVIATYHTAFLKALRSQAAPVGVGLGTAADAEMRVSVFGDLVAAGFDSPAHAFADDGIGDFDPGSAELVQMTATIVASYVGRKEIAISDVDDLIETVHGALSRVSGRRPSDGYSVEKALDDAAAVVDGGTEAAREQQREPSATATKPPQSRRRASASSGRSRIGAAV